MGTSKPSLELEQDMQVIDDMVNYDESFILPELIYGMFFDKNDINRYLDELNQKINIINNRIDKIYQNMPQLETYFEQKDYLLSKLYKYHVQLALNH